MNERFVGALMPSCGAAKRSGLGRVLVTLDTGL